MGREQTPIAPASCTPAARRRPARADLERASREAAERFSHDVLAPSTDTVSTTAPLDLCGGPLALSITGGGERYTHIDPFDADTDVLALLGQHTEGNQAADFAIVGPEWTSPATGVTTVRASTNCVWLHDQVAALGERARPAREMVPADRNRLQGQRVQSHEADARSQLSYALVYRARLADVLGAGRPLVMLPAGDRARGNDLRRLALIFALFWLAQGAVCLLPGVSHAHHDANAATSAEHSDHEAHSHHGASGERNADAPLPDEDSGCEHHCASLSQALSPTASAIPWIVTHWLALGTPEVQPALLRVATRSLDTRNGPPPPDLVITNASLLI